jgi:hypothetical protein
MSSDKETVYRPARKFRDMTGRKSPRAFDLPAEISLIVESLAKAALFTGIGTLRCPGCSRVRDENPKGGEETRSGSVSRQPDCALV